MDPVQLIYSSCAKVPFDDAAVGELAAKSAVANSAVGVTGALLFSGRTFIQLLEGEEASVRALFAKIAADPRHGDVRVLSLETHATRIFENWGMADIHETDLAPASRSRVQRLVGEVVRMAASASSNCPVEAATGSLARALLSEISHAQERATASGAKTGRLSA